MSGSTALYANITTNITDRYEEPVPSAFLMTIIFVVSLGAVILNFVVLYKLPHLQSKINTSTRYAMFNLAITHVLFGLSVLTGRIIYLIDANLFLRDLCVIDGFLLCITAVMRIFGLGFLNLDKFLSLKYPFHYKAWMTKRKMVVILVGIWISCLAIHMYGFALERQYMRVRYIENTYICFVYITAKTGSSVTAIGLRMVLLHALPFLICIGSVIGVFGILKAQMKNHTELQRKKKSTLKKDYIIVYMILAMDFTYCVMTSPYFVCISVWNLVTGSTAGPTANFVAMYMGVANSAVNPLIYIPIIRLYCKQQ